MVDAPLADECRRLQHEVAEALKRFGIGRGIYAYEVDGYGNQHFMDEANVPNLLALPYSGYGTPGDPVYVKTRQTVLSDANPWFFSGRYAHGIGGPHTGVKRVWPLAITMQALTSTSDHEIHECLAMLLRTDADRIRCTRRWIRIIPKPIPGRGSRGRTACSGEPS